MSRKILCTAYVLCVATFVLPALAFSAGSEKNWEIGAPIVTYWAGPGDTMAMDDRAAAQIRAGGWNLGWALKPEHLDVLHRYGLRGILQIGVPNIEDSTQSSALDDLIDKVKDHPALYAYYLTDEPGARAFSMLGKLVAYLRKKDPAHLAYINLFPTYANEAQLGVSADAAARAKVGIPQNFAGVGADDETVLRYREHLRQFIDIVKPDLISYDHYHFLKNTDGQQYFMNLSLIRVAALEAKRPFLNIIQTCDSPSEGWRGPGENELRWLTYTSLAYGAQGISHFRYDVGLWQDRNAPTVPLPLYWSLAKFNREFVAIATECQPLKSLDVYHCGALPIGGQALPPNSVFTVEPSSQEVLLGYFGEPDRRPTHVVIVNLDYKNAVTTALIGPGPMEVFHPMTETWSQHSEDGRVRLDLEPGGGILLRLKK